ncbi:hypothetical protein [Nocardia cyriacigeorgica]|uniref:hypothetical protein n=1 Tax=Nocardia cyriacigeorgica TaxID=135487 RepID=UPI0024545773|nr:hypothetical protein [Nocardia cyriacigeorgica]
MPTELNRWVASLRPDPRYLTYQPDTPGTRAQVLIVGQHAAFATPPTGGTPLATFPGLSPADVGAGCAVMGLVRVEYATRVDTTDADGILHSRWEDGTFAHLPHGIGWRLMPAQPDPTNNRWVIATGRWATGNRQALLPRAVLHEAPGAPTTVPVHDHNPYTGRRWQP